MFKRNGSQKIIYLTCYGLYLKVLWSSIFITLARICLIWTKRASLFSVVMMILDISGEEHLERLELSIKLLLWFEFQKHQNNFTVRVVWLSKWLFRVKIISVGSLDVFAPLLIYIFKRWKKFPKLRAFNFKYVYYVKQ